ncbi:MAG: ClpX C4-type zinc finger protein [Acidimicrobiales bacterium]
MKKHLERRARSRPARTGEPYATALPSIHRQRENRMPSTPTPAADVIASCSFCAKPDTAVRRIVAGPGVYDRSTEEILALLPSLVRSAHRIEGELAGWVNRLRERGSDWQAIAGAAGISVEAARQRFEH